MTDGKIDLRHVRNSAAGTGLSLHRHMSHGSNRRLGMTMAALLASVAAPCFAQEATRSPGDQADSGESATPTGAASGEISERVAFERALEPHDKRVPPLFGRKVELRLQVSRCKLLEHALPATNEVVALRRPGRWRRRLGGRRVNDHRGECHRQKDAILATHHERFT